MTSHIGEYLGDTSTDTQNFWVTRVPGDTIVIEVWISQDSNLKPNTFPFEIKSINHYFRDVNGDLPSHSLHSEQQAQQAQQGEQAQQLQQTVCSVSNNTCNFGDDTNVHRAIANMLYTDSQGQTSRCTGSFLNNGNTTTNTELYFLTAFHCIYPGFSQNTQRGSDVDAQIYNSRSSCSLNSASESDQLVGNDVKFIAASEAADWALLWVNKSTLQRADGSLFGAISPTLLGWTSGRLADGSTLETLHHARSTLQNYAQFEFTAIANARAIDYEDRARSFFDSCQNIAGCTHYGIRARTGGIDSGASGSLLWNPRYQVRAVLTHGQDNQCVGYASRFDKIYEDGRVSCALDQGNRYYPQNTSNCDNAARPVYSERSLATLIDISLSEGMFNSTFTDIVRDYFATVDSDVSQLRINIETSHINQSVTINGSAVSSRFSRFISSTVPLSVGNNTIVIGVTSADNISTSTYTLQVTRRSPALTRLSLSSGTLNPSFNRERFRYATTVASNVGRITLTPIADSVRHRIAITANGRSITGNVAPLNVGDNTIVISVSTRDNQGTMRYTLVVTRLEPCLTALSLSPGSLSPTFGNPNQCGNASTRYTATVDSDIEQIALTPTANSARHRISIIANGNSIAGNVAPLNVGNNNITVSVSTRDNQGTIRYTLVVTRSEPCLTALSLSPGSLSPTFGNPSQCGNASTRYAATVASDTEQITLTPTANSARHGVFITANGISITGNAAPVNVGDNTIVISVSTRDNQATARYTLIVTRLEPCLTALSLSSGSLSPTFGNPSQCGNASTQYTASVDSDIERITLTTTANGAAHRVSITANGISITGNSVPVNVGDNTIVISVSTRDNQATTRYTLVVTRSEPCLTALSLSSGLLSPTFERCSDGTVNYSAIVRNDVSQIVITATADRSAHTITFNDSQNSTVPLSVGDNTITVSVITADGMARKNYNLVIRRLSTATLTGLAVEANSQMLELNPDFSLINLDYRASIENTMTTVTMMPTASAGRTIRVRYTPDIGTAINRLVTSGDTITIAPLFFGTNDVYIDVMHNGATEIYSLTMTIGIKLRIKLFLEGALQ